jgi:tetratricopeptide (TPR) repeat protein
MASVRTVTVSLVVAAIVAFAASPAQAQDAEKARQLFQQGSKYYDLGQFDKAIEAWQQGYDQKPDPGFLYNIAQAYRQKQDATKAIFFYKGYLRNSPKAHNRAEVEQKIAALQKQLDAGGTGTTPPPNNTTTPPPNNTTTPPPNNTTTPPPNNTTGTNPPPDQTGPSVTVQPPPPNFTENPTTVVQVPPPPPPSGVVSNGRIDLTGAIGPAFWSSGVNGTAKPSFVLKAGAGYYFGAPMSRFRFRAGGLLGYTFLGANDDGSNVSFISFLIDPTLEIRLNSSGSMYLDLDIALQILGGLNQKSRLLAANEMLSVNGAQGMFETRVGAAFGYRLSREFALFSSLSNSDSKKKQHFYADITRLEWLFGVAYRL